MSLSFGQAFPQPRNVPAAGAACFGAASRIHGLRFGHARIGRAKAVPAAAAFLLASRTKRSRGRLALQAAGVADRTRDELMIKAHADSGKKLDLIELARSVCHTVGIHVPGLVVVGEQSAGKSSLLENISGIQFPRAQNTCTRMPCVLSMLTDPDAGNGGHALVSMDASFKGASKCKISEVEGKIEELTEQHAQGASFISSEAMYVRVVRKEGPQLCLIDLPGVTHNSKQMTGIHEVTKGLVEKYIKQEEMVICCVVPAMSDFGNAEVIKMARAADPDGRRTLGVVTKCDDAARAEANDLLEKVLMERSSDVNLEMGFHCVVNRSQKDIDAGLSRDELWAKETEVFEHSGWNQALPEEVWGTARLIEKIARIQESRIDECLPTIQDKIRDKIQQLQSKLRKMPVPVDTEAEQFRLFDDVVAAIQEDVQRRVKAEFVGNKEDDKDLTIAPKVAEMVHEFQSQLLAENPNWLSEEMIEEVSSKVKDYIRGYTVDNLIGSQVFISIIQQVFVIEGLLENAVDTLVEDIDKHLGKVVKHIVDSHASEHQLLASKLKATAEVSMEKSTRTVRDFCKVLVQAQSVTFTTHGSYTEDLARFRAMLRGQDDDEDVLDVDEDVLNKFLDAAERNELEEPTMEICASLHVYTGLMINTLVEAVAKLVIFNMVDRLAQDLAVTWRVELGRSNLQQLFPPDKTLISRRRRATQTLEELKQILSKLEDLPLAGKP